MARWLSCLFGPKGIYERDDDVDDCHCHLGVQQLNFKDIYKATDGFDPERLLGKGGYGNVYLGKAPDGRGAWAVKRPKQASQESLAEFHNEVRMISRINHRNLLTLLGYCCSEGEQILVYNFLPNGNLLDHLQLNEKFAERPLTFDERLEIAVGTARGLHYLHSFAEETIVHMDIKSTNIMLDAALQPKVSDFGLSKMLSVSKGQKSEGFHITTRIVGTPGYVDPEYYKTFHITAKSDVYSFGVVLLELITGKPAVMEHCFTTSINSVNSSGGEVMSLASWAVPFIVTEQVADIVDPNLEGEYPPDSMELLAGVARICLRPQGAARPRMAEVRSYLETIQGTRLCPGLTSRAAIRSLVSQRSSESSSTLSWLREGSSTLGSTFGHGSGSGSTFEYDTSLSSAPQSADATVHHVQSPLGASRLTGL